MKRIKLTRLAHVVLLMSALFSSVVCLALTEKTPLATFVATTQNPFVNGSSQVIATDNRFSDMHTQTALSGNNDFPNFYNKKVINRIILSIDPDQLNGIVTPGPVINPLAYTFSVQLSIVIWKYTPGSPGSHMQPQAPILRTMTVNYDPAKRHAQQAVIELTGMDAGNKIEVTAINPITFNPASSSLPYKITLGAQIEVERYYKYGGTGYTITPSNTYSSATGLLRVTWALPVANNLPEEYELEWIYIDNYPAITAANLPFSNELFKKNSTRVSTQNTYYQIPVIYPHGFIVYRIRPFWRTGYDGYNSLAPGMWTSEDPAFVSAYQSCLTTCGSDPDPGNCINSTCNRLASFPSAPAASMYFEILDDPDYSHETNLNWQYSLSFAEGAKSVASVNYFDGSYKSRQTVIKPIKDDAVISSRFEQTTTAQDIIYDHYGRAAISTLPVPTDEPKIRYNRLFSLYAPGVLYSADHFNENEGGTCNTKASPMHSSAGSAKYYSPNHEFPDGTGGGILRPEEKYIPDAKGFPFTQSVFSPDNTGRIIKKSGLGIDYAIGKPESLRHETRYFYGKPFQEELDRWFGSEVGDASHYKKDMVIDANGQISISYLNPSGKVIATNLAGIRPAQMDTPANEIIPAPIVVDLLHKSSRTAIEPGTENRVEPDKYRKMLYRELLVDRKQEYYFGYEAHPETFQAQCEEETICYDCVLDLTISLTDECGNEFLKGAGQNGVDPVTSTVIGQELLNQMIANPSSDFSHGCEETGLFTPEPFRKNLNKAGDNLGEEWSSNVNGEPVDLEVGNYSLKKILKVNQAALDQYTKSYLEKACLRDEAYFKSIEENKISKTGCNITCEECKDELGAFSLYDCDNPAHDPAYPCLTIEEYDRLLAECDEFCDISMKCKAEFEMMLGDMNPQGQYGQVAKAIELVNGSASTNVPSDEVKPHLFALSVFNESNFLPVKTEYVQKGILPNWRYPYVPYRNESGAEDFITVYKESNGNFTPAVKDVTKAVLNMDGTYRIKPQYLANISDFLNYWKPSWARSLVYYHPEYGYYEICSSQSASNDFDDKWMSITTYADAIEEYGIITDMMPGYDIPGFLYPLWSYLGNSRDPYFHSDNPTPTPQELDEYNHMSNMMLNFLKDDATSSYYSMQKLAYLMVVAPNFNTTCTGGSLSHSFDVADITNLASMTTAQKDLFWNNFKSLYNSLKQRVQDKKMARLAITQKNSYNGCIGQENFNVFKHNFAFTPFVNPLWFPYTPWWSQFFNFEQPCNFARYAFYKDKMPRFMEATSATKLDGFNINLCYDYSVNDDEFYVVECPAKAQIIVDEAKAITELAVFKQCGQCPLAADLQALLNGMLKQESPDLLASSVNLSCGEGSGQGGYPELTNRLFTAIATNLGTGLKWTTASAPQLDGTRQSYYLDGVFTSNAPSPLCSLRLQLPDNSQALYNFDDILQFYTLKYDPNSTIGLQSNGSFTAIAIVKKPGYNSTTGRHLTEELIIQGYSSCLDLANCSFQPICRTSKAATELENLFNNLLSDKHPNNPSPVSPSKFFSPPPPADPFIVPDIFLTESLKNSTGILTQDQAYVLSVPVYWQVVSSTSTALTVNFKGCNIVFNLPPTTTLGYSYAATDIFNFSGIRPDPDNQPGGFIITAKINNGSAIDYVQIKGSSGCYTFGTCATELPYPYQMGKPEEEDLEYDLNANLVYKLKNAQSPMSNESVLNDIGVFIGWVEESNPCSARFEMPPNPYPAFSFTDVLGFVDIEPDKERKDDNSFIGYARLRDGRIVPLKGYTVNCAGGVSACRYAEQVTKGTFEDFEEQDYEDQLDVDYAYADDGCEEPGSLSVYDETEAAACAHIKPVAGHTSLIGPGSNPDQFLLIKNSETANLSRKKVWNHDFTGLKIGREYIFKMYYMNAGDMDCAANDALPDGHPNKIKPDFLWVEFATSLHTAPNSGTVLRQELTCDPETGWKEFTYVWKANVSSLTINIYNEEMDERNYLALDDISFGRSCPCVPVDMVYTGNFNASSPSIDSDLNPDPTPLSDLDNGEYIFTQLANSSAPNALYWGNEIKDHTKTASSKFVLARLAPLSVNTLWKMDIPVEPGKEYVFNAWYNVDDVPLYFYYASKIRISLKVNGQIIQQFLSGKGSAWNIIEGRWPSGGYTMAHAELVLENLDEYTSLYVAVDDIGFSLMCQPGFCHPPQELELPEVDENPCLTHMNNIIELNAKVKYAQYLIDVKKKFQDAYIATCLQSYETFLMKYNDGSNHITLYYYDQAGNLVRTIPPNGVVPLTGNDLAEVEQDRRNGTHDVTTYHTYATTYRYNSLNQLVAQSVPDNEDLDIWNTEGINNGISSGYTLKGLSFVSKYGINVGSEGGVGKMYKTSSSGSEWEIIDPEIKLDKIIDIHVIDANNSIALASNGRFLVTSNGASSWVVKSLETTSEMVKMRFTGTLGSHMIYIYDKAGNIWKSDDLGNDWDVHTVTTPLPSSGNIRTMNFYGSTLDNGVAITTENRIFFTSNGGAAWTEASGISLKSNLTCVQKVNNYLMVAAGKNGTLLRSANQGDTWAQVNTRLGVDIKEVYFSSANDGSMLDEAGNLYYTADGGNSWTLVDLVKNKLNDDGPYVDIAFINKNEGYALNSVGQLLYTNNGGKGWSNRNNASALVDMSALFVVNANELFIVGKDGKMRYSLNGGASMVIITESIDAGYPHLIDKIHSIHLSLDAATGHYKGICSDINKVAFAIDVDLLNTTPAVVYSDPSLMGLSSNTAVQNVYFSSAKQGYVLASCLLYHTNDGGATWNTLAYVPDYLACPTPSNLPAALWMESVSTTHRGIIVGEAGMIYYTTDISAPTSMYSRKNKVAPLQMRAVKGAGTNNWVIVGDKGTYMTSADNGSTWNIAASPETTNFFDMAVNTTSDVTVAGTAGFVKQTYDEGVNWSPAYPGISPLHDIKTIAINYSTGYPYRATVISSTGRIYNLNTTTFEWNLVTGLNSYTALPLISYKANDNAIWLAAGSQGKIFRTTNIATTSPPNWEPVSKIELPVLHDVKLLDQHTAYAVGTNGTILKTENLQDAVSTWELQTTASSAVLNAIDFTGSNGVAVGNAGAILKTTNGGASWTSGILGAQHLNAVELLSPDFGVIAGNSNTIYKNTTDVTGSSWSAVTPPAGGSDNLYGISIVNKKYWVVVGAGGTVYQNNEQGTWAKKTVFHSDYAGTPYTVTGITFKDVYFKDYFTGYVLGQNGELFKTANKCSTFVKQNSGTSNNLEAISYVNNRNIFIGGETGGNSARRISDEKNLSSTVFYYDKLGRLVVSQNSKQRAKAGGPYIYSYTRYDVKGRIVEAGEKKSATAIETTYEGETGRMSDALFSSWLSAGAANTKTEVTRTYYDEDIFVLSPPVAFVQDNLRSRVASITLEAVNDNDDDTYDVGTHYSYDIYGYVKTLLQEYQNMPLTSADKFKRVDYDYDLVSGKVNRITYQRGLADQFMHKYEYDEENKLTHAYTSTNGAIWEQDARYLYYRHGPLARAELGHDKVQGIDYAYTIQGRIKGVNSNTVISAARDMGHDGLMGETANPNRYFAQDEFGYSLGYYQHEDYEDYTAINAPMAQNHFLAGMESSSLETETKNLFNGNISHMVTGIRKFMQGTAGPQAMIYTYDQLNRIASTKMTNAVDMSNNQWGTGTSTSYNETFRYDANGNITKLTRKNDQGQLMDDLTYKYLTTANGASKNTNKLGAAQDAIGGGTDDIESGQVFNTSDHTFDNYQYDQVGNLVKDEKEEIANIDWTVSGKIRSITRISGSAKPDLEFLYDAGGNRIAKIIKPAGSTSDATWKYIVYVRDAQGNILTTYERKTDKLVDYASLNYTTINNTLVNMAGSGGFTGFINSMHSGNAGLLNNLQGRVNSDAVLGETILRTDMDPNLVLNTYNLSLYKTVYLTADIEAMCQYYDEYSQTTGLRYIYEDTRNLSPDRKLNLLGHMLTHDYSRKNYLWGGIQNLPFTSCVPFAFYSMAANMGFSGPSNDFAGMDNYINTYIATTFGTHGMNKAVDDVFDAYENWTCLGGSHYDPAVFEETVRQMYYNTTDEPQSSLPKVISKMPQAKMHLEAMTLMKYYNLAYGSFIEWLASTAGGQEMLVRALYLYNKADADNMFASYFSYPPADENDAVNFTLTNIPSPYSPGDMTAALNSIGIYDNSFEMLMVMQLAYSAFPGFYNSIMVTVPDRAIVLNDPDMVELGTNELLNMGVYSFPEYATMFGVNVIGELNSVFNNNTLWDKLLSFSNGTFNINWYIDFYRNNYASGFLNAVTSRQPSWVSDYQQSTNLYGGANGGLNNYFIQIRNYFGADFYERFEQEFKNTSTRYQEEYTLEDWNIYGSSRVGSHHANKVLYSEVFTGTISSNKLIKSSSEGGVVTLGYSGTDAVMRGDKRFELVNHLGNVLTVVSDRVTPQQANYNMWVSYALQPNGRIQPGTGAGIPLTLGTISCIAGQTYKLDVKFNPNTTGSYSIVVKDYPSGRILAQQVFSSGSTTAQDYSLLYKGASTVCQVQLVATLATTWHIYNYKAQAVYTNAVSAPPLLAEDYTSGTGSWSAWSANLALSNSSGRLKVDAVTPTSVEGLTTTVISTVAGKQYRVRAYIDPTGITTNAFIFGSQDNGFVGFNSQVYVNSAGWYEINFTAATSSTKIITGNYQTTPYSYYIDNLTVEEIAADQFRRMADVIQATDYYAFGSPMPGRTFDAAKQAVKKVLFTNAFESAGSTEGWSAYTASAVPAQNSGRLRVQCNALWAIISKTVPVIKGRNYVLRFTIDMGTATSVTVPVYDNAVSAFAPNVLTVTSSGTYEYRFVAHDNIIKILYEYKPPVNPASGTYYLDNISLEEEKAAEGSYAFGFNGMEGDDETYGEGNEYDFGARIYDPRLARWLTIDPMAKKYPEASPYNYALNNPIYYVDPDGGEVEPCDNSGTVTPNAILGTLLHAAAKAYFDTKPGYSGEVSFSLPFIKPGRADLVYKGANGKAAVWEIKPVSYRAAGKNAEAQTQVARYRALAEMEAKENGENTTYSIGTSGGAPLPFTGTLTIPFTDGIYNYEAKLFIPPGQANKGIMYYTLENKGLTEEAKKAQEVAANTVKGAVVAAVVVGAVAAAPATSGGSLAAGAAVVTVIVAPPEETKTTTPPAN